MTYKYNNKEYVIEYEVEDLSEHMYNAWLVDDNGNEINMDDLPGPDKQAVYDMVDQDAIEWAASDAYDRAKDLWKYGE